MGKRQDSVQTCRQAARHGGALTVEGTSPPLPSPRVDSLPFHDASSASGANGETGAAAFADALSAAACASSALCPISAAMASLLRWAATSSSVGHLNAAF
eukprot:CAMPEP_0171208432 /NCGR_PEP_ID=MMETSP0790-20130122/28085_1 /TAXON_ID=2925 /ORGANISM="Alexandrium catenella, Strain OF101" /LENGTH=99 /DNA_ID=CAMNT_0011674027 /DNA_START=145 /DNA_END=441 /DNA_ORIENTATION=+